VRDAAAISEGYSTLARYGRSRRSSRLAHVEVARGPALAQLLLGRGRRPHECDAAEYRGAQNQQQQTKTQHALHLFRSAPTPRKEKKTRRRRLFQPTGWETGAEQVRTTPVPSSDHSSRDFHTPPCGNGLFDRTFPTQHRDRNDHDCTPRRKLNAKQAATGGSRDTGRCRFDPASGPESKTGELREADARARRLMNTELRAPLRSARAPGGGPGRDGERCAVPEGLSEVSPRPRPPRDTV
jgi:hypothetical protein